MVPSENAADAVSLREAARLPAGVMEQDMERDGGLFRLFLSYPPYFTEFRAMERTTYEFLIRSNS